MNPKGKEKKLTPMKKLQRKRIKVSDAKISKVFDLHEPFFRDTDMYVCLKHGQLIFISEKSKGEAGEKDTKDEL